MAIKKSEVGVLSAGKIWREVDRLERYIDRFVDFIPEEGCLRRIELGWSSIIIGARQTVIDELTRRYEAAGWKVTFDSGPENCLVMKLS